MKSHLDKLKDLIQTGDVDSINQAMELADALYAPNSNEMKEIEEVLEDVLKEYAYVSVNKRGGWATSDYKNLLRFAIPLWLEIALEYRNGKIIARVSLDWSMQMEWEADFLRLAVDEFVLTEAHEKAIAEHLNIPVSKTFVVEDLRKLEDDVVDAKGDFLRKVDKDLQVVVDKIGKRYYQYSK